MGDAFARQRSINEETEKEPYGGVQSEGGARRAQGGQDAGGAVREVRSPRQSDRAVEDAVAGRGAGGVPDRLSVGSAGEAVAVPRKLLRLSWCPVDRRL